MLSGEMNARMPREMEAMMDLMQSQISRAISSAISERIIPEIQNMVEHLPLSQHGVEPCTSTNEDGIGNVWKNANTKFTKKDSRSACHLRDHTDNIPYTTIGHSARIDCTVKNYLKLLLLNPCENIEDCRTQTVGAALKDLSNWMAVLRHYFCL